MLEVANELFAQFNTFAKASPVVAGIAGLWGVSVLTFFFRGIPTRIWGFIKRQGTTSLVINNHDEVYHDFLKWTSKRNFNSFVRNLNFNNGNFSGDSRVSIGYGTSWFFYKKHLFFMYRYKEEASQTKAVKEVIDITVVGRNQKIFDDLFKEIQDFEEGETQYLTIKNWKNDYWRFGPEIYKRPMSTIVLDTKEKEKLIKTIQDFIDEKSWYVDNGIPYHIAILLYGPPGTGKSSLLRGLCTHFNRDLYMLSLTGLSDTQFLSALSETSDDSIIGIEDIDSCIATKMRKSSKKKKSKKKKSLVEDAEDEAEGFSYLTISGLLNGIDGVSSGDNRILIATTNHPEKLDPALLREGRFGVQIEIGYLTREMLKEFFARFYPDFSIPKKFKLRKNVAPCEVQKLIFDNRQNPKEVLKGVS